jgi:hypothetical protein
MSLAERYNKIFTGLIAGFVMPLIGFTIFFLLTRNGLSLAEYLAKVVETDKISEVMSVSVFSNIIVFLAFNRLDMLRSLKGVLGITFAWAFLVFAIKLL